MMRIKQKQEIIYRLNKYDNITEIVSGGAKGADGFAERYAKEKNIPLKVFKAGWDKYGKRAGYIRNKEIWEYADQGIAFWDGRSRGTAHSFELSKFLGKKIKIITAPNASSKSLDVILIICSALTAIKQEK